MTLFIFEGPRGAGKTTLLEAANRGVRMRHWQRPLDVERFKLFEEVVNRRRVYWEFGKVEISLLDAIDWEKVDLLVDRHPAISEFVYRSLHGIRPMEPVALQKGSAIVYVYRKSRIPTDEGLLYHMLMSELSRYYPVLYVDVDSRTSAKNIVMVKKFLWEWSCD